MIGKMLYIGNIEKNDAYLGRSRESQESFAIFPLF